MKTEYRAIKQNKTKQNKKRVCKYMVNCILSTYNVQRMDSHINRAKIYANELDFFSYTTCNDDIMIR